MSSAATVFFSVVSSARRSSLAAVSVCVPSASRLTKVCAAGDLSVEIDRVVNSLMQEGVTAALQELQRRSPPSSSGETSSVSPFGYNSPSVSDSPRGPSGFSAPAAGRGFAYPFPAQQQQQQQSGPHSAGSSLRGAQGRWLELPEGGSGGSGGGNPAMRRSLSADMGQGAKTPSQPRP
jgi:hypothetical protein